MDNNSLNSIPWNDYSSYIKSLFGTRVQKISVDAGFTCPNRDGTKGTGACIYCTNKSFSPFYCNGNLGITQQLEKGISFFSPKYKTQKYLAYFQSYTNTYDKLEVLEEKYLEALSVDGVVGLVIATRPDCINQQTLDLIKHIAKNKYVSIEFGAESTIDKTLDFINRGHSYSQTVDAVKLTTNAGLNCGLHLIIGLPGENKNDFINHALKISKLPIKTLKIHQMQVLKGTKLKEVFDKNHELFYNLNLDNYIDLIIEFLENLNPEIVVERFTSESPKEMIVYPDWNGKKNFEISSMVQKKMNLLKTYQGKIYESKV